jgi:hypothetical protein
MKAKATTPASTPASAPVKETKKEVLPTRASALDAILLEGGTWEELTAKADAATAPLKTKIKHYPPALLKTHIRYREAKRKNFFSAVKVTDEGIVVK